MKGFQFAVLCLGLAAKPVCASPFIFTTSTDLSVAIGQTQRLNYTITNASKKAAPISGISIITNTGDTEPSDAVKIVSNNCASQLSPGGSCSISITVKTLIAGMLNRTLTIASPTRRPLQWSLSQEITKADTTILVYIVGSDLESGRGAYASKNIAQMEKVGSSNKLSVVIETGGAEKVGWYDVKRQLVQKGETILYDNLGDQVNMALAPTIQSFITWGVTTFPANHYILVFWDHGGGPNGGYGGDENFSGQGTPINSLVEAVQGSDTKFEIIGFDTCLLGSAELAGGLAAVNGLSLTPFAQYMVGSEDLEPGNGWEYNTFLDYVNHRKPSTTGLDIGKVIVDGFLNNNEGDTTTLSVIDLSFMQNLVNAVNTFALALNSYTTMSPTSWKTIAKSRVKAPDYNTSVWTNNSSDVVDLIGFAQNIQTNFPSDAVLSAAASGVITATQQAVQYFKNSSNRGGSLGLTTYFPSILSTYLTKDYSINVSLNGTSFYPPTYIALLDYYYDYYNSNKSSLQATFSNNFTYTAPNYTATLSNDYDQLYAAVGSDTCSTVNNGALPCFATMQFSGIDATQAAGNSWNISFNYVNQQAAWPIITGSGSFNTPTPMFIIDSDVTPSQQDEQTYLIPVTQITPSETGFLQLQYSNGEYKVVGFLGPNFVTSSTNTTPKITEIEAGTQFYLRAYAQSNAADQCFTGSVSGTWCLMPIQRIIEAPLSISFGALPQTSAYNKIAFLVADLTGALNLTQTTLAYPPP